MRYESLKVPPRSLFAAVVLNAMQDPLAHERQDWPTLRDLTQKIIELKQQHNLDTSDISIRADKGGWVSDDLSSFVNRFVLFGLASQNPVRLSADAVRKCTEIIRMDHRARLGQIDRLLELLNLPCVPTEPPAAPRAAVGSST